MKRIIFAAVFCLCIAGGIFGQKKGDTFYVAVQSASLKSSTGFFARTTGTLRYGEQVSVLAVSGKWAQVRSTGGSLSGWTSSANLTAKRIVAQGDNRSASAKELALAGKGFSQDVERQYKTGKDLNYGAVDALEKVTVSDQDLLIFIEEGHLSTGE